MQEEKIYKLDSNIIRKDLPEHEIRDLYRILWDKSEKFAKIAPIENLMQNQLVRFLVFLKSFSLIEFSSNPINSFQVEEEIKILEIDKQKLISRIIQLWWKEVFNWHIEDIYYDFPNKKLDKKKKSFRIRLKTFFWEKNKRKIYYTLKKKDKLASKFTGLRSCYEKELEVLNYPFFENILWVIWLRKYRRKQKERISYSLDLWKDKVKLDIDDYAWIPTLLEIEIENKKILTKLIDLLWLNSNERISNWSRGLFYKYSVEMETFDLNNKEGLFI